MIFLSRAAAYFYPEDGCCKYFRNDGTQLPNYTTSLGSDDCNLDTHHHTNITTLINTRRMVPRRVT